LHLARGGQQPLDNARVAEMNAVEIADRHGSTAKLLGQQGKVAQ
jgi:hypothetical protein